MPIPFVPIPVSVPATQGQGTSRASIAVRRRGDHDSALAPLASHLRDPNVTDVFVSAPHGLFVDRGAGAERIPRWSATEAEVRDLAVSLISAGGRHIDETTPCVDVRLSRGERVHAVLPPIAIAGTAVSIRLPMRERPDLAALEARGFFGATGGAAEWVRNLVHAPANVLISGATGSGKTTLLTAMLSEAPRTARIVTIEDVSELRLDHPHHVALEARQPNLEGSGGIGLARLVREALRMRPDRLIVGECRGEEVRELLSALNTGHEGGAGTIHANAIGDVPARLEALGALAGLDGIALARQAVSAFHVVLHVERAAKGQRRLSAAGVLAVEGARLSITEVKPW